jgi:antitoxin MazE
MKVAKWGNSLAIRIPKDVVKALGLQDGDEVELRPGDGSELMIERKLSPSEIIERIAKMAKPIPPGWKFDRDEANAR